MSCSRLGSRAFEYSSVSGPKALILRSIYGSIMSSSEIEAMYSQLVQWYSQHSLTPRREVERNIAEKVAQGKTREQAIRELYEERTRFLQELVTPVRREAPLSRLEASLEPLRYAGSLESAAAVLFLLLFFSLFMLAVVSMSPEGFFVAIVAFMIVAVTLPILLLLFSGGRAEWRFEEEITLRGASGWTQAILETVPKVFQSLTLEEVLPHIEGNRLQLKIKLTRSVVEWSQYGTATRNVDLGFVVVEALFEPRDSDLHVKVSYSGEPPKEHASLAANEYEKLVVAFRSAVNEAWERVKPKPAFTLDFERLAELIASKGFVIAAVRCPYCGGSVDLPRSGDIMKCSYCGTTLKAVEVYEIIKRLVKDLT